jgi:hypothetical protein
MDNATTVASHALGKFRHNSLSIRRIDGMFLAKHPITADF